MKKRENGENVLKEMLLYAAMGAMIAAAGYVTVRETTAYVTDSRIQEGEGGLCVVIDAGHGGGRLRRPSDGFNG